jgi:hypothetical protein
VPQLRELERLPRRLGGPVLPFFSLVGAENRSNCACVEGFHAPAGEQAGERCLECPVGGACVGTGKSTRIVPLPLPGFYARAAEPEVMLECTSLLACPRGGVQVCADGYEGDLCSDCSQGFFYRQLTCEQCQPSNRALAISSALILIVIALAVYWVANPKRSTEGVEIMSSSGSVASEVGEVIFFLQTVRLGPPRGEGGRGWGRAVSAAHVRHRR